MLVGLGGMTRYSFAWLIVPVMLFLIIFGGQQRIILPLIALIVFALVMTPWIIRNFTVSGTPFGTATYAILENTPAFTEHRLQRSLEPEFTLPYLRLLTQKLLVHVRQVLTADWPRLGGGWIAFFFLPGLLIKLRQIGASRLRYFLIACLALLTVVQALGGTQLTEDSPEINSENLLVLLLPLVLVYGVSFFYWLLDQLEL